MHLHGEPSLSTTVALAGWSSAVSDSDRLTVPSLLNAGSESDRCRMQVLENDILPS